MLCDHVSSAFLQSPFSTPLYTYHAHGTLANGVPLICNDSQLDNCVKECARMFQPLDQKACVDAIEQRWAPYSQCFSGDCTVVVRGKQTPVRLCDVIVGDFVMDYDLRYVEVVEWLHREPGTVGAFLQIETLDGRSLTITCDHLLFDTLISKYAPAIDVTHIESRYFDGTLMSMEITSKVPIERCGIYAPLTSSGSLMVNGIRASCYASPSRLPLEITHELGQVALFPFRFGNLSKVIPIDRYCRGLYHIFAT